MRIEVSKIPDSSWDERLLGSKTGTIYQSTAQYEYQKINSNMKHEFLKFLDFSGKVCAQVMLSITQRKGRIGQLSQIPFIQNNLYRWSYGPVIFLLSGWANNQVCFIPSSSLSLFLRASNCILTTS